jgi:DNA (cytosine-5)-methyltransferase 1
VRIGSLFAGIGGFDLAASWMGWETAWFSEIDPYASAVLAQHWPGVPNHGDITAIDFRAVEPVDLLCGGFPCQDISNAGKRAGIDGERSGLWSEYARAIGELRPRYVVVENVAALLGRGLERVLGDLAALGYDAEWEVLSAADVGAPHLRERLWIVAYPNRGRGTRGASLPGAGCAISPEIAQRVVHRGDVGKALADASVPRLPLPKPEGGDARILPRSGSGIPAAGGGWWAVEPPVGRVAHGIPAELDGRRETFPTPDYQNHRDGKVRRKAAKGRHGVSLHHYIEGGDEASNGAEAGTASGSQNGNVRGLWEDAQPPATPPEPCGAGEGDHSLPGVPHEAGSGSGHLGARTEETEAVRDLWNRIYTAPQQEALDLFFDLLNRVRPEERGQALASIWDGEPSIPRVAHGVANRVDRLSCLGNAIVPLCAFQGPFQVVAQREAMRAAA